MNTIKVVALLTLLTVILIAAARLFFGPSAVLPALVISIVMNFGAWWFSDRIALSFAGAKPVTEADAPELYRIVGRVAETAGLPTPRIFVIDQPAPNAFATGRDPQHAVVAVTKGILDIVNERELTGVLAHELGHVRNRDTFVMAVVASVAGAISYMAQMAQWSMWMGGGDRDRRDSGGLGMIGLLLGIVLLPLAAMLVQLAVSRSREYGADESGARLVGYPNGLASALRKLGTASAHRPLHNAGPATAHMFIVNPLSGRSLMSLFSTHPPLEKRIERLMAMGRA